VRWMQRKKSALEDYLASILPFGGRHPASGENLREMVPTRLARNVRLHRQLRAGQTRIWSKEMGLVVPVMALPVHSDKVIELHEWIARGLIYFHWQIRLTHEHDVTAVALAAAGEETFDRLLGAHNVAALVQENLKQGTFCYEGAQGVDDPTVTAWRFAMYGGLKFADPDRPSATATRIGVMTGPHSIKQNVERAIRFGLRRVGDAR
jgi:hypothetical protein